MKILALLLLMIFGVFLYFRAQKLLSSQDDDPLEHSKVTSNTTDNLENITSDTTRKEVANPNNNDNHDDEKPITHNDKANSQHLDWVSEDLTDAVFHYSKATTDEDKYHALLNLISICYKNRKDDNFLTFGSALLDDFMQLIAKLVENKQQHIIEPSGHMQLSTLLVEHKNFHLAMGVCMSAQELELDDGTRTGFAGRIQRITKLKDKTLANNKEA